LDLFFWKWYFTKCTVLPLLAHSDFPMQMRTGTSRMVALPVGQYWPAFWISWSAELQISSEEPVVVGLSPSIKHLS